MTSSDTGEALTTESGPVDV